MGDCLSFDCFDFRHCIASLRSETYDGKRARFVLMLVISGSVGNLIDRLRVGAVADFLSFTFGDYAFPTFNVADSLITVGTVLLVLFIIFDRSFFKRVS